MEQNKINYKVRVLLTTKSINSLGEEYTSSNTVIDYFLYAESKKEASKKTLEAIKNNYQEMAKISELYYSFKVVQVMELLENTYSLPNTPTPVQ